MLREPNFEKKRGLFITQFCWLNAWRHDFKGQLGHRQDPFKLEAWKKIIQAVSYN